MKASNCVNNIQGIDRDEYLRLKKLHESTPIVMIPATGPESTVRVHVQNTPTQDDL